MQKEYLDKVVSVTFNHESGLWKFTTVLGAEILFTEKEVYDSKEGRLFISTEYEDIVTSIDYNTPETTDDEYEIIGFWMKSN